MQIGGEVELLNTRVLGVSDLQANPKAVTVFDFGFLCQGFEVSLGFDL